MTTPWDTWLDLVPPSPKCWTEKRGMLLGFRRLSPLLLRHRYILPNPTRKIAQKLPAKMAKDLSPLTSPEPDSLDVLDEHPAALGDNLEEEPVFVDPDSAKPSRRKSRRIAAVQAKVQAVQVEQSQETNDAEEGEGDADAPPRKRRRKSKKKASSDGDEFEDENADAKPRRKRRAKVQEPVVYDIPPVERKTTTFRGRLGYVSSSSLPSPYSHHWHRPA